MLCQGVLCTQGSLLSLALGKAQQGTSGEISPGVHPPHAPTRNQNLKGKEDL